MPEDALGPAGYGLVAVGGWQTLGAGEAELLEEVDSWGGRSVGVAVEFLMGGFGGRPRCCKRKNAMRSGAEGFEVHSCGVGVRMT